MCSINPGGYSVFWRLMKGVLIKTEDLNAMKTHLIRLMQLKDVKDAVESIFANYSEGCAIVGCESRDVYNHFYCP